LKNAKASVLKARNYHRHAFMKELGGDCIDISLPKSKLTMGKASEDILRKKGYSRIYEAECIESGGNDDK
jgi:hypothetical protein